MNRAWIPAGALAGVSVAGLLALGPLTDSLSSPVTFSATAPPASSTTQAPKFVAVDLNVGKAGSVKTKPNAVPASLHSRGGVADDTSSAGQVSTKVLPAHTAAATTSSGSSHTTVPPAAAAAKPKKKVAKRPSIIGGIGQSNPDSGLASGDHTKTSQGESSSTPGSTPTP